jgi:pre-rRNA-processing protein IPI3
MLSEIFVTSIRAEQRSANSAISKDVGIYVHTLHPTYSAKSTFKKSSTKPNCTAVSSTHIFAAQADKAVVHVYSRERGNQETLISFPERIHCLALVHDGLLAVGTVEGRIILWEVCYLSNLFPSNPAKVFRSALEDKFLPLHLTYKRCRASIPHPNTS